MTKKQLINLFFNTLIILFFIITKAVFVSLIIIGAKEFFIKKILKYNTIIKTENGFLYRSMLDFEIMVLNAYVWKKNNKMILDAEFEPYTDGYGKIHYIGYDNDMCLDYFYDELFCCIKKFRSADIRAEKDKVIEKSDYISKKIYEKIDFDFRTEQIKGLKRAKEYYNEDTFSKEMNYIKAVPFYKVNEQILNFENKNVSLYVEAYKQESQRAW